MKTQMRVQKVLMLVSLVVSALVFVYALVFMTGGLADVYRYIDTATGQDYIHCDKFVSTSQSFVSTLVAFGIVMVVLVALMYFMACNTRRKYYITNYIAVGLFVVFALVVAIYMVVMVANIMDLYQNDILWKSGEGFQVMKTVAYDKEGHIMDVIVNLSDVDHYEYPMVATNYTDMAMYYPSYPLDASQTYNFALGFVMFVIVIADAVCVALCTVWKFFLIKGENKLLAMGAPATEDVAQDVISGEAETAEAASNEALGDKPVKEEE